MAQAQPNPNPVADDEDSPIVTMDITQDPYQLLGQLGIAAGGSPSSRLSINNIVGADLTRLDLPQMLDVLRSVYERKGNKMVYRPRSFRVSTQSGALTDIQASLFKRFQTDQEEINHLLDLLTPLRPDADEEDCDAIRALVRDDIDELVIEAGWPGGPRRSKITEAFRKCDSHLLELRDLFGLDERKINTATEAENWSRFVIITELVTGLEAIYDSLDAYLDRTGPESFGNQVIWFNRALSTFKETSVRMQFQLRARFVGPEELATKLIKSQGITIAELLAWSAEVCDKGALISTRAGRVGFGSLASDLGQLEIVYNELKKTNPKQVDIPELYKPQIQATIDSILNAIAEAKRIAQSSSQNRRSVARALRSFKDSEIAFLPRAAKQGEEVAFVIYGPDLKNLKDNDLVLTLESPGINTITVEDFKRINAKNAIQYSAVKLVDPGTYDLVITRKSGGEVVKLKQAFEVKP